MISKKIEETYKALRKERVEHPNVEYFSKMLASWLAGESALPQRLGLSKKDYKWLMEEYFRVPQYPEDSLSGVTIPETPHPEVVELVEMFMEHRAGVDSTELQIATIMASGCLSKDHLWHDLGLWCRPDLSSMIQRNFPSLFAKNYKNMKWKKFFYKQMCLDLDLAYTCKVPSCSECVDYYECYPADNLKEEFDKSTFHTVDYTIGDILTC